MEMVDLQNDIVLKNRSRDSDFWGLVSKEKYPLLTACALRVSAYFGSTYLCEMAFSQMKIIKSKYRSRLTDRHLTVSGWLSVAMSQTSRHSLTVFSHSHHTNLSYMTASEMILLSMGHGAYLIALRILLIHITVPLSKM